MTTSLVAILGASIALAGSLFLAVLGTLIVMRRTQSSSLFMEDQMGFIVAKVVLGAILIIVGFLFSLSAINRLLDIN